MDHKLRVLRIDSSGRAEGSATRGLLTDLVGTLERRFGELKVVVRDLASGIPHVDQEWIDANFTAADDRTDLQAEKLRFSDSLVAELHASDVIAIGMPIYNFGIPAALKAWIDLIARARLTFRYTENGPVGLLTGKKVFLVIASGGVQVDSVVDFATPYMRQALRFVGITDVQVIAADQLTSRGDAAIGDARNHIEKMVSELSLSTPAENAA